MLRKIILSGALMASAVLAVPGAASAQSFGFAISSGPGYYHPGYYGRSYDDRHDSWRARHRWEERRRWEHDNRRRYWDRELWEDRGWHGY
jgi:hypothetical protein